MALADFIQELQTQDNIVYSNPPESTLHIIPPENVFTKITTPDEVVEKSQPVATVPQKQVIKLKLTLKNTNTSTSQQQEVILPKPIPTSQIVQVDKPANVTEIIDLNKHPLYQNDTKEANNKIIKQPPKKSIESPVTHQPQTIQQSATQNSSNQTNVATQKSTSQQQLTDEQLFVKSGTEFSKKAIWMEFFIRAKTSKKSNAVVNRMKLGKFTLTPDNKVLLLPDYDVVNKDPDDILKDKWF